MRAGRRSAGTLASMEPGSEPCGRSLAERWEALEGGVQAAIAYPVAAIVLFLGHAVFFPRTRWLLAITYGLFWAIPATAAIVSATASERRKRARRREAARPAGEEERGAEDGPGVEK